MNKIVISQKNAWKILFFLCAIVALNVPGSIFYNDYSEKLVVLLGMIEIAITGLICVKSNKVNSLLATGVAEFVTPFLLSQLSHVFQQLLYIKHPMLVILHSLLLELYRLQLCL